MLWTFLAQSAEQQTIVIHDAPVWANLAGMLCVLAVELAIFAFVCWLLYDALQKLPPEFRKMEPAMVWLLMIPLWNLVWNFFVFQRVPESYANYFHSRGRTDVGDAGRQLGLIFSILAACSIIPCVNIFTGIAALVLLIIVLVKITGLKGQITTAGVMGGGFPMPPGSMPPGSMPPPPTYTPPPPGTTPPPPPPPQA